MALSECGLATDERERELKKHGSAGFPVACYHDDLSASPVPWHWHDELEIAIVEKGMCRFRTGTEERIARTGEAVFLNANVLHMCMPDEEVCILQSIVFSPFLIGGTQDSIFWEKYLNPLYRESGIRMLHLGNAGTWEREAIFHAVHAWEACAYEITAYEVVLRNELSLFIAILSGHLPISRIDARSSDIRNESRIKQMLSFIRENYPEEIDTAMIAASANVSESEALRCFKKMLGTTPIRYLLMYRLEKAESLLATTALMVSEIGVRCGFHEMSYFAKAFQRKNGCTPKEYRNGANALHFNG